MTNYARVERALHRGLNRIDTIAASLKITQKQVSCALVNLRNKDRAHIIGTVMSGPKGGGKLFIYAAGPGRDAAVRRRHKESQSFDFRPPELEQYVRKMTREVCSWMWRMK